MMRSKQEISWQAGSSEAERAATHTVESAALDLALVLETSIGASRMRSEQLQALYSAGLALASFVHYLAAYDREGEVAEQMSIRGAVLASLARVHRYLSDAAEVGS